MENITKQLLDIIESARIKVKDLELVNPNHFLAKAQLISFIQDEIKKYGVAQQKIADMLEISQASVGNLINSRLERFSVTQLITTLNGLRCDVKIVVTPVNQDMCGSLEVEFEEYRR